MQDHGHLLSEMVDELDLALVHALQIAPRAPWTRIAGVLGVNPVTASRRWDRLTREGIAWMSGYASSPLMSSMPYALIGLTCGSAVEEAATALVDDRHATTVYHTIGSGDLLLGAWLPDLSTLARYLITRIDRLPGVTARRVWVTTRMHTEASRWRLGALDLDQQSALGHGAGAARPRPADLSTAERDLVLALGHDGRASYEHLATRTGLSTSTVQRRLQRLVRGGELTFRAEVARAVSGWTVEATLFLDVPPVDLADVAEYAARLPQTRMCASVTGTCNLALTVWLQTFGELEELETRLTSLRSGPRVSERYLTLRHLKMMGRVLDDSGRLRRDVPLDIWSEVDPARR